MHEGGKYAHISWKPDLIQPAKTLVIDSLPGACILDGGMFEPSALQPRKSHHVPRDQRGTKPPTIRTPRPNPSRPLCHPSTPIKLPQLLSLLLTRCPPATIAVGLVNGFLLIRDGHSAITSTRGIRAFQHKNHSVPVVKILLILLTRFSESL